MHYWSLVPTDLHGLNIIVEWHIYIYIYRVMLGIQLILQPNAYKLTWHPIWK